MNFLNSKSNIPKIAYTVTGSSSNALRAAEVIKQQEAEPVDLWLLHRNPDLHKHLEARSHIHRVFVSPVRDVRSSNPDHHAQALPVYGRYDEVVHLGVL